MIDSGLLSVIGLGNQEGDLPLHDNGGDTSEGKGDIQTGSVYKKPLKIKGHRDGQITKKRTY